MIRIIPRLDIKGPNLVKGIRLEGLRVLGKPEDFAKYYYAQGADELFFQDTVASLYDRNSLSDIITRTAASVFIPLTVGGGIRNIEDVRAALGAGADKVAINTAAVKNPDFIREAAHTFGSSTIVISIEAIKQSNGKYLAYIDNGREETGLEVSAWAKQATELGAGEIVITSVDREGTGEGYDLALIKLIKDAVTVPVISHGGAASAKDVASAVKVGGASAVALASILHYDFIARAQDNAHDFSSEGNTSFLTSGKKFNKIVPTSLSELKKELQQQNLEIRL